MIKAVIFDLDDTLLNDRKSIQEAFKATCGLAAQKHAINPALLEENVRIHARKLFTSYTTYNFTQKIGINPFEGLWGTFDDGGSFQALHNLASTYQETSWVEGLQALHIDDEELGLELAKAFSVFRKKLPFVFDDTFHVLEELKKDYQLLLLTNGSPSLQNIKLEITPELKAYFNDILISGDFGVGKPDPSIFQYILERNNLTKEQAIMIGDNLHTDILGSNRIGMENVWINRNQMEINDIQPTYEIKRLRELLPIVKKSSIE
ncbi:HAD family hydrolase [Paucisalibacillus sp. EB02]|uniref:HAD family hydrolase n=1 Tax=Paucisalibacillus sp. EB02 TaxID=1347087 RepID=UPI0005AB597E|nr:HAD family hydrolase [Paucisalibacillus sp. EB02]